MKITAAAPASTTMPTVSGRIFGAITFGRRAVSESALVGRLFPRKNSITMIAIRGIADETPLLAQSGHHDFVDQ